MNPRCEPDDEGSDILADAGAPNGLGRFAFGSLAFPAKERGVRNDGDQFLDLGSERSAGLEEPLTLLRGDAEMLGGTVA